MPDSTALLITSDSSLVESCREVIRSITHLSLDVLPQLPEADAYPRWNDVALVVFHTIHKRASEEVARWLRLITSMARPISTLVISERYHAQQALTLLQLGAAEYLSRPLDLSRLAYLMDSLTVRARHTAPRPAAAPPAVQALGASKQYLFMTSGAMGRMMQQVQLVAGQETTVLLGGETGTGKTRLAQVIHELSSRREQRFMVINCGALAENLIESEMFGHVKGAFTGADRDRPGKFADVGAGTILLDDIDALPLSLQAKLLRVVEERVFEPVGSNQPLPMRARLIVASNRPLDKEVDAGRFRSDLYYRLNVVCFSLPPLRERREILRPLIAQLLTAFAARDGRPVPTLSAEACRALEAHKWPGNIRELRNVLERAIVLCPGPEILLEHLPETMCPAVTPGLRVRCDEAEQRAYIPDASTLGQVRGEAEAQRITEALRRHRNNRLRAAAELGISRMTLYKKLHKYGLTSAV